MNLWKILIDSWHISWSEWRLWVLTLAMFVVLVPAVLLSGGLSFGAALVAMPMDQVFNLAGLDITPWVEWLHVLSPGTKAVFALGSLLTATMTSVFAWILQAAAMRGTLMVVERGKFTLQEAFTLGRSRFSSLLQLSLVFGLLMGLLTLAPALLMMMVDHPLVRQIANLGSTTLAPLNLVLGLGILFVMMSIALEDVRPRAAFSRAWGVFKSGWRLFLAFVFVSAGTGLLVVLGLVPLIILLPLSIVLDTGWALLIPCAGLTLPVILLLLTFTGVFDIVFYTLAYRAAADISPTRNPSVSTQITLG